MTAREMIMKIIRRVENELLYEEKNYAEFSIGAHTTLSIEFDDEGKVAELYD